MGYQLEGRLLDDCACNILCPCWVGEDPDPGTCQAVPAHRIDRGTIDGVDVAGLTVGEMDDIPGNILKGNIRGVFFIDENATPEQARPATRVAGRARRPARRSRRPLRRGRPAPRPDHLHRRAGQRDADHRRLRRDRALAVHRSRRAADHPQREHLLDHPRLTRLRQQGLPDVPEVHSHNAIQGHFAFTG